MARKKANINGDSGVTSEMVYTTLRERICLNDYPPASLISENALATEFGVGRSWIRGILHRLEYDGLVTLQSGGITVTPVSIKTVREAYQLRIKFLGIIAEEPYHRRITPQHIATIEKLLEEAKELCSEVDPRRWAQVNMAFHECFMSLVHNDLLTKFMHELFYLTIRVWLPIIIDMGWEDETESVCEEMEQVLKALRASDMRTAASIRRDALPLYIDRLGTYLGGGATL